ncbi:unnamed protein product [Sphagnum jensenii]|uniref:Uncharacterized protein n=1 Tax=Sphagnum jensenii TaxID=128206 RepID=A0ABP1ADG8_9BRYO
MVNKLRVDSFDLADGLDDSHWNVKVFALHHIAAPRDDLIGSVVGMSKDQVNQHDLNVENDGKQGEELHDKLRLVLFDVVVEDDHQDFGRCLFTFKHCLELIGMVHKSQATQRIRILTLHSFIIKQHVSAVASKVNNNKVRNHQIGVKIIGQWLQMPIMKHGEASTEILNFNMNRGHYGRGCHVDVTNIMNTVVVVTIGDDSTWNRLIGNMLLDELLDKS